MRTDTLSEERITRSVMPTIGDRHASTCKIKAGLAAVAQTALGAPHWSAAHARGCVRPLSGNPARSEPEESETAPRRICQCQGLDSGATAREGTRDARRDAEALAVPARHARRGGHEADAGGDGALHEDEPGGKDPLPGRTDHAAGEDAPTVCTTEPRRRRAAGGGDLRQRPTRRFRRGSRKAAEANAR